MKNDIGCGGPPRPGCWANTRYDPAASAIASADTCGMSFFMSSTPRARILSNVDVDDVAVRLGRPRGFCLADRGCQMAVLMDQLGGRSHRTLWRQAVSFSLF